MASESHNPFRRRTSITNNTSDHTLSPTAPAPSSSDFARTLSSLASSAAPPPAVTFAKPKPVKKVRVQSPPPSSPESAGAEYPYPKYPLPPRDDDYESSEDERRGRLNGGAAAAIESENPFLNEAPPLPEGAFVGVPLDRLEPVLALQQQQAPAWTPGRGPPPNPFQKTLEDMEREAREGAQSPSEQTSPTSKAGMDVEAFKRLLMTGQGPAPSLGGDTGSMTETSSISRQSIFENTQLQDTPRTSHETEPDDEKRNLLYSQSAPAPARSGSRRKKPPPPPASRKGKPIKTEFQDGSRASLDRISPTSPPSEFNKPLPLPPDEGAAKNIFDKEAAGKLPELDIDPDADVVPSPRPPTPPNVHHSASTPVQTPPASTLRKPAPPPRRHGRSQSSSAVTDMIPDDHTTPPRSSLESQRSRSSLSAPSAPPPPPPRRGAAHRQSPSMSSSSNSGFVSPSYPFPSVSPDGSDAAGSKPMPPPQRNTSLRKNASTSSRKGPLPPPPPARSRVGSKGSMDGGVAMARTRSVDSGVGTVPEEESGDTAGGDDAVRAMLADLEALQREVDAARALAEGGG